MGYRIEYHPVKRKSRGKPLIGILAAITAAAIVLLGRKYGLAELLLPGDGAVTAAALEQAAAALGEGQGIWEAFQLLCIEVLEGAQIY